MMLQIAFSVCWGSGGRGEDSPRAPLLGSHLASPGLLVYLLGVRTSILSKSLVSISATLSISCRKVTCVAEQVQ